MRILEFEEVDEDQALVLNLFGLDYHLGRRRVEALKAIDSRLAPFVALYAVEDGAVLGQVGVLRVTLETTSGPEAFGALWAVTTRPDRTRSGIAARLVSEAHRRLGEQGLRHSLLTTSRSLVAHGLYEKAGYRDLVVMEQALAFPFQDGPRSGAPEPMTVTPAGPGDLDLVYDIYVRATSGMLGFVHRDPAVFRAAVEAGADGDVSLEDILIVGEGAGYAIVERGKDFARLLELRLAVGTAGAGDGSVVGVEQAYGRALSGIRARFRDLVVVARGIHPPAMRRALSRCGFESGTLGPGVLMVADLAGPTDTGRLRTSLGVDEGRFAYGVLDAM